MNESWTDPRNLSVILHSTRNPIPFTQTLNRIPKCLKDRSWPATRSILAQSSSIPGTISQTLTLNPIPNPRHFTSENGQPGLRIVKPPASVQPRRRRSPAADALSTHKVAQVLVLGRSILLLVEEHHVFVCQDPNALYEVVDRMKNGVLLVSDFGRLESDQASLVKDVILPYSHRINSFGGDVGVEKRESLMFFMGNRYRKEGGKIRDILFQLLENEHGIIMKHGAQSRESRHAATHGMHMSKFCLHPAGDTPSACRLFDAIVTADRIRLRLAP